MDRGSRLAWCRRPTAGGRASRKGAPAHPRQRDHRRLVAGTTGALLRAMPNRHDVDTTTALAQAKDRHRSSARTGQKRPLHPAVSRARRVGRRTVLGPQDCGGWRPQVFPRKVRGQQHPWSTTLGYRSRTSSGLPLQGSVRAPETELLRLRVRRRGYASYPRTGPEPNDADSVADPVRGVACSAA